MTDVLKIDVASHVAAIAHAAASRTVELLCPDDQTGGAFQPAAWFNGGWAGPDDELHVQALGAYVLERREPVHAEQLFIKAGELQLHAQVGWAVQPEWVRSAYEVFTATAVSFKTSLLAAQARAEDELRRPQSAPPSPEEKGRAEQPKPGKRRGTDRA